MNGTVLGGRYELAELLGQGGMAEVYRARDQRLGRQVAVKMLRADLARDPSFERRFAREAQAAAGMNHPNVVAVFDTGSDVIGGTEMPWIVMEFVDGITLKDLLATGRRLLPQRALEVTAGVLAALEYSHQRNVIHRDIKPANVMLTKDGAVKVMDFGIARALDDAQATMTQASTVMGTAQYLSPEQGRGESADARSDIYATGCLLYELLTSRPPFVGDTTASVVYQHVRENPVPPSQIDPEVPTAADAVVLKAMAKNPENRYQTAAEMRADVLRAAGGEPVRATPVLDETAVVAPMTQAMPVVDDAAASGRRRRGYIVLALAVVGALILGFFLLRPLFESQQTVRVPDLTGLTVPAATALLENEGLEVGQQNQEASDAPIDTIFSQDPQAGSEVSEGTRVSITVSTGPAQTTVPVLQNLSLDAATIALAQANLKVGERTQRASDRPAGTVLDSDPASGTNVAAGSTVNLVVASGKTDVPSVVGQSQAAATQQLQNAGFKVEVTKSRTSQPGISNGDVINQDPKGGTQANIGSTVLLTVAEVVPPTTVAPPPATTPAATP